MQFQLQNYTVIKSTDTCSLFSVLWNVSLCGPGHLPLNVRRRRVHEEEEEDLLFFSSRFYAHQFINLLTGTLHCKGCLECLWHAFELSHSLVALSVCDQKLQHFCRILVPNISVKVLDPSYWSSWIYSQEDNWAYVIFSGGGGHQSAKTKLLKGRTWWQQ